MCRTFGVLAVAAIFSVPVLADEPIAQVNNQESFSVGIAPLHASEVALGNPDAPLVNHVAGTKFLFGYDAARTRTVLGIPDLYTDLDVLFGVATLRYDGSTLDSSGAVNGQINQSLTYVEESVRLRVGRSFEFFKAGNLALTPFLGLTQKAWGRDTTASGIADYYDHQGVEVGALVQASLPCQLVFGADAAVGRALGTVLFDGSGNRIFATTTAFALKLDHRTFADWHQRLEIRQSLLRYGQAANVPGAFEPRRSSDLSIMLEIGAETSVF